MLNSILFTGWALLCLFVLLVVFRLYGKTGLVGFMCAAVVLVNIFVTKSIRIFGLGATGGNILYAALFLATDLISEYYGGKEARKAVLLGFVCAGLALGGSLITLAFRPASWDWAHDSLAAIFKPMVRIVIGSMTAYLISQNLDTLLYAYIRKRWKPLWLRNNGSTWVSQFVDTLVFCLIGLLGTMPLSAWLEIIVSTYILKIAVAALDTPYIYISKLWLPKELRTEPTRHPSI